MRKLWKITTKQGEVFQGVGKTLKEALPKSETDFYGEDPLIESEDVPEVEEVRTLEQRVLQLEHLIDQIHSFLNL